MLHYKRVFEANIEENHNAQSQSSNCWIVKTKNTEHLAVRPVDCRILSEDLFVSSWISVTVNIT